MCLPRSWTWACSIFKHILMFNWIWCLLHVPSSWLASLNVHGALHLMKSTNTLGQLHDVDKSVNRHVPCTILLFVCYITILFWGGNPNSMIWTAPVIGRSCSVDHRPGHLGEWTAAEPRGNGRGLEVLRPGRIRAPPQHGWVQNLRYEIHFPANFREQEILFFFRIWKCFACQKLNMECMPREILIL